ADIDLDPARLAVVQVRRAELSALAQRYGPTVDEVIAWGERAAARHAELSGAEDQIAELTEEVAVLEKDLSDAAGRLTAQRRGAAERLAAKVTAELRQLAMGDAVVTVEVNAAEPGPHGA